ncbi:MAG: alpha/beta fold hydrolase, partial [SAR324 cluster bacterium]|nr:alpha/beta fold hydrolase [SAR324 cluster bacterium]
MMEKTLTLPRLGETMEEGTVLAWSKITGEEYDRGDILLELETDKMVVEVPALEDGKILEILAEEGAVIGIGEPIARVEVESTDSSNATDADPTSESKTTPPNAADSDPTSESKVIPPKKEKPTSTEQDEDPDLEEEIDPDLDQLFLKTSAGQKQVRATPAARRIAARSGMELHQIQGTGPFGRISVEDVRKTLAREVPKPEAVKNESILADPNASEASLESEALNISYLRKGPSGKTPLVFLHGFGADLNSWRFNVSLLSKSREVWSLDLPGHGDSWE